MRPVLCIRPEPGLSNTLASARQRGLAMTGIALFEVEGIAWEIPDPAKIDAILLGSANAIRHGGDKLQQLLHLPVFAVGKATAKAASYAGFEVKMTGSGGLQNILDALPDAPIRLLRLSGQDNVHLSYSPAQQCVEVSVYRSIASPMPDVMLDILNTGPIVALHSVSAAQHFASECSRMGVSKSAIELAALAPRIALAVGEGWQGVSVSPSPDDTALLAMIENMCQ